MIKSIILILFYLLMPAVILRLCNLSKLINKIGAILICYVVGLLLSQTGLISADIKKIPEIIASVSIPIALPMLIFSANINSFKQIAGKAFLSMMICLAALTVVVISGYYIFGDKIDDGWKVAGMLYGLSSGGTPNVAAIKTALNADNSVYIYIHTLDTVLSGMYILFLISVAKPFFLLFLKDYPGKKEDIALEEEKRLSFREWISQVKLPDIFKTLGVSLIITVISVGIGLLIKDETAQMTVIILLITSLGILCSFIPKVKSIEGSYDVGMYIILIFSIAVASMADFSQLQNSSLYLLMYMAYVIFVTFFLHIIFCKIFNIDTDTLMITSVALICSPPFVPIVAAAIKNRDIVITGITVGIIGYVIGNYLGISIAYLLK